MAARVLALSLGDENPTELGLMHV